MDYLIWAMSGHVCFREYNFGPPKELPRVASEVELEGVWDR